MRIIPILSTLLVAVTFSSCGCGKSSGGADGSSSWKETPLTANSLPPLQINVAFETRSWIFANMLRISEAWILPQNGSITPADAEQMAQTINVNENGWPIGLPQGYQMQLGISGYPTGEGTYLHGVFVLTWEGTGTVQLGTSHNDGINQAILLSDPHRTVMVISDNTKHAWVTVTASSASDPVRNMRLWAPAYDGAGLTLAASSDLTPGHIEGSLEPLPGAKEPMWHPVFLTHIRDMGSNAVLRFMSWININQSVWSSSSLGWSDRANPEYQFASFAVCDNVWTRHNVNKYRQKLGLPYEWLIDLCNETNNDLWIQVPHIATEDLTRNLSRLIAGKNGHPGLNKNHRVWFEYSNEIWNGIDPYINQYNKARNLASSHFGVARDNLSTDQVGWGSGQLQGEALAAFEDEWSRQGETDERLVNVVAGFALGSEYNRAVIQSVREVGADLPEALAITTYFGMGTQGDVFALHWGSYTAQNWPASLNGQWPADLYDKTKAIVRRDLYTTYPAWRANARVARDEKIHLVCYEGGQHMLPVGYGDHANPTHEDFMNFMASFQRSEQMRQLYLEHYALWSAAGGRTASLFVDVSGTSFYGYWGAKELVTQNRANCKKWDAVMTWVEKMKGVHALNEPVNAAPSLADLPMRAESLLPSSFDISASGGDGALAMTLLGGELPSGVTFTPGANGHAALAGTPPASGMYRFVVRALDADGDPSYKVYTLNVDPAGVAAHSLLVFRGEDIPSTVQSDGTANGRYDITRAFLATGARSERTYVPFSIADGSALFNQEYKDNMMTGGGSISATSQLNMYGGVSVIQTDATVGSAQSTYTTLREHKFVSWTGGNLNGVGTPTDLDIFLAWRKDQFTGDTAASQFSFGADASSAGMRVDITDLIADGDNEIRFVVQNRESGVDQWYISESAFVNKTIGDGYFELTGFTGSSVAGKQWAPFSPTADSYAIPSLASLAFAPHTFSDIRAAGIVYHGHRWGYHYNFGFNRFIILGERH